MQRDRQWLASRATSFLSPFLSVGARHAMPERVNSAVRAIPAKATRRLFRFPALLTHRTLLPVAQAEAYATETCINGAIAPSSFAGHGMPCPY
jgi:hypothetical protein